MPYALVKKGDRLEATLTGADRDTFFRDAVALGLAAVYSGIPAGEAGTGAMVPVQAAGADVAGLLAALLSDVMRAAREAPGVLHPPKWMAFDDDRVTATLPVGGSRPPVGELSVEVLEANGAWPGGAGTAKLVFSAPVPASHG